MNISSVKALISALRQLSYQSMHGASASVGPGSSQKVGNIKFSVERMISIIANNIHSMVIKYFLKLVYWICTKVLSILEFFLFLIRSGVFMGSCRRPFSGGEKYLI